MASKFFEAIRGIAHASEFENYCERIQVADVGGMPTVEEARQDYRAALWAKTSALTS